MAEDLTIKFKVLGIPLEKIDPSGQMGPGDPHASGHIDNADNKCGGIYIAKEKTGLWHIVGAGLPPLGWHGLRNHSPRR